MKLSKWLREEDEADKWLREQDPYYLDKSNFKRKHEDRPYETPKQEARRRDMEIPFSSLSLNQSKEAGIEYDKY